MKTGILQKLREKRKIFALVMILVCVITTVPDSIVANAAATAETPAVAEIPEIVSNSANVLWADGSSYSDNNSLDAIKWHYDSSEKRYYLYLPSSANLDELTIWHSFSDTLYVDGTMVESGETTNIFAGGGNFTVKVLSVSMISMFLPVISSQRLPRFFSPIPVP